jgi:hypothetical protein
VIPLEADVTPDDNALRANFALVTSFTNGQFIDTIGK